MYQDAQVQLQAGGEKDEGEPTPRQKKVNNLSSFEPGKTSLELLSKGPNFALTQKISEAVILEAEKGVQCLAYAKVTKVKVNKVTRTKQHLGPCVTKGQ